MNLGKLGKGLLSLAPGGAWLGAGADLLGGIIGSKQRNKQQDLAAQQFAFEKQQAAANQAMLAQRFGLDQDKWNTEKAQLAHQNDLDARKRAALDPARGKALAAILARLGGGSQVVA